MKDGQGHWVVEACERGEARSKCDTQRCSAFRLLKKPAGASGRAYNPLRETRCDTSNTVHDSTKRQQGKRGIGNGNSVASHAAPEFDRMYLLVMTSIELTTIQPTMQE